jgi:hypothetical protein
MTFSGLLRRDDRAWTDVRRNSHLLRLVPRSRTFLPWRWGRYFPPKSRFTQDLHGIISQKTAFFLVTAVKTSNLIRIIVAVLYRYEGPCFTLRGRHIEHVCEQSVRKTDWPKKEKVIGGWWKFVLFSIYHYDHHYIDQIKKGECGECSTQGTQEELWQNFSCEALREETTLRN